MHDNYLDIVCENTICDGSTIVYTCKYNLKVMDEENLYLQVIYDDQTAAHESRDNQTVLGEENDYIQVISDDQAIAYESNSKLKVMGGKSDSQNVLNAVSDNQVTSEGDYTQLTNDYEDNCTTSTSNQELFTVING